MKFFHSRTLNCLGKEETAMAGSPSSPWPDCGWVERSAREHHANQARVNVGCWVVATTLPLIGAREGNPGEEGKQE